MGSRVRDLRLEKDFSFDAFVEETGLGRGYLSELERGLVVPSLTTLGRLAKALELTVADLVVGETPREQLFELCRNLDDATIGLLLGQAARAHDLAAAAFRRVPATRQNRFRTALPLERIRPAAGGWSAWQRLGIEAWVEPARQGLVKRGRFVAQVVGSSMEPQIPNGAYAVFERPWPQPMPGELGVFARFEAGDPPNGARLTIKEYAPHRRRLAPGSSVEGVLRPMNRAFKPLRPIAGEEHLDQPFARFVARL